jgi:hypothetical protein
VHKFELGTGNQSPDSEDSDGDVIFGEQQVESTGNIVTLMNYQDNLRQIHDANPLEPHGVSNLVSQLYAEDSQEEEKDDFRKSTIIKEEIDLFSYAVVEVDNSSLDRFIEPILPLILSSHFAQNSTFMEAIEEDESFIIHECDYK